MTTNHRVSLSLKSIPPGIILFAALSLAPFSCGKKDEDPEKNSSLPTHQSPPPVMEPDTLVPPPGEPPDPCDELVATYQRIRGESYGRCETDQDCTILPGGVDDCGRAVNRKTAERLRETYDQWRKICKNQIHCAPRMAIPACRNGHCVEIRAREGLRPPAPK